MYQMPRRGFLAGLGVMLAAPAIIRIPKLLMPIGRTLPELMGPMFEVTDASGARYLVPLIDGKAIIAQWNSRTTALYGGILWSGHKDTPVIFKNMVQLSLGDSLHVTMETGVS